MEFLNVKTKFKDIFGGDPLLIRAPGRINLIGEHTDYNNGFVMPAAIDKEVVFAVSPNNSTICRFFALDMDQKYETKVDFLEYTREGWPNYLMGVMNELSKKGHQLKGFDCVFGSNIPIGAGLSSSAAIECGMAMALNRLFDLGETEEEIVKLAQRAENDFVGVNCGIMDQFASMFGKADHVFRLDCRSLEYEYFPFRLTGKKILLIDTQVKHSLASSEYNTRREECEMGVDIISGKNAGIKSLRDVSPELLTEFRSEIDPVVYKRCHYVVNEIDRVLRASTDLEKGDIISFGEKMYETHRGLSEEYEVSCAELDFLVEKTVKHDSVFGARMMGGGFGGCTINLVESVAVEDLKEIISNEYRDKFGQPPLFYEVTISDGVSLLAG